MNQQLVLLYNLNKLPNDLKITTISFTFDMNIIFNIKEICDYYELKYDGITTIKYCVANIIYIRSLYPDKYIIKRKKRTNKKKKTFSNQVTLIIDKNKYNNNNNDTNIKIFNNGAIQVSGCSNYDHFIKSFNSIFSELLKDKYVWENKKFILKSFTNSKNLSIDNINNFKINLINTGFYLGFNIDRALLNELLLSKGISCSYEPAIYAGISITHIYKYKTFVKKISVIVFEKGYIMINGGLCKNQIMSTYKFIVFIIYEHFEKISQQSLYRLVK